MGHYIDIFFHELLRYLLINRGQQEICTHTHTNTHTQTHTHTHHTHTHTHTHTHRKEKKPSHFTSRFGEFIP